jgi:DNA polymerase iota
MDVTDIIDYNAALLNYNNLASSFFHLDRNDPTVGFSFDASYVFGHIYPVALQSSEVAAVSADEPACNDDKDLLLRLRLGSHLAQHLRHRLDEQKGYTSTVGISTNKLISKLVGNVNKPTGQTTLVPPYNPQSRKSESNVTKFIDDHDIGKIPGIGFKTAQKIRNHVLGRPAAFSAGLVYGPTKESVKVRDIRTLDGIGPELLGRLLAGPGVPKDLGEKVWGLINGVDDAEVAKAREVPQQISIVSQQGFALFARC